MRSPVGRVRRGTLEDAPNDYRLGLVDDGDRVLCCVGWNVTVSPPWYAHGSQETDVDSKRPRLGKRMPVRECAPRLAVHLRSRRHLDNLDQVFGDVMDDSRIRQTEASGG